MRKRCRNGNVAKSPTRAHKRVATTTFVVMSHLNRTEIAYEQLHSCRASDTLCFISQRARQGAVSRLWDASALQSLQFVLAMAALRKSKAARPHTSKGFNARAFYDVLAGVVEARSVAWRQVARETGITPSTLTRMGQGRQPDAPSLAALAAWAGLNPADFVGQPMESVRSDPLVVISRALRSDPDLQPEAAKALEDIMRIAYERFSRQAA